jgi:predicted ATP-grasp superfamily ATP-dependent carboligase
VLRVSRHPPASGGALVLGASYRTLGVARSLGRRGVSVWVIRTEGHTIAGHSRYVGKVLPWPTADGDEAKVAYLLELAERHGLLDWTLIPTDDETAAMAARSRAALSERYIVAAADWDAMRWAYDKRLTYQLACDCAVPQPQTWLPGEPGFDAATVTYPSVLKPAFKRERNRFTTEKAWPVANAAELATALAAASELVDPAEIIVQELIPGDGRCQLSYAALVHDGEVVASLEACRARQYPMDFGRESTYVYTIDSPDVEAAAAALIAGMNYSGLVEIEFKRDSRDGLPKLLDINPRVWGWQSIGPRAGVDFVDLQWRLLHGETLAPARGRTGVRWIRGSTDFAICLRELLARRLSLLSYLGSLRPPRERAMFALDDPLPGLLDAPVMALRRLRR